MIFELAMLVLIIYFFTKDPRHLKDWERVFIDDYAERGSQIVRLKFDPRDVALMMEICKKKVKKRELFMRPPRREVHFIAFKKEKHPPFRAEMIRCKEKFAIIDAPGFHCAYVLVKGKRNKHVRGTMFYFNAKFCYHPPQPRYIEEKRERAIHPHSYSEAEDERYWSKSDYPYYQDRGYQPQNYEPDYLHYQNRGYQYGRRDPSSNPQPYNTYPSQPTAYAKPSYEARNYPPSRAYIPKTRYREQPFRFENDYRSDHRYPPYSNQAPFKSKYVSSVQVEPGSRQASIGYPTPHFAASDVRHSHRQLPSKSAYVSSLRVEPGSARQSLNGFPAPYPFGHHHQEPLLYQRPYLTNEKLRPCNEIKNYPPPNSENYTQRANYQPPLPHSYYENQSRTYVADEYPPLGPEARQHPYTENRYQSVNVEHQPPPSKYPNEPPLSHSFHENQSRSHAVDEQPPLEPMTHRNHQIADIEHQPPLPQPQPQVMKPETHQHFYAENLPQPVNVEQHSQYPAFQNVPPPNHTFHENQPRPYADEAMRPPPEGESHQHTQTLYVEQQHPTFGSQPPPPRKNVLGVISSAETQAPDTTVPVMCDVCGREENHETIPPAAVEEKLRVHEEAEPAKPEGPQPLPLESPSYYIPSQKSSKSVKSRSSKFEQPLAPPETTSTSLRPSKPSVKYPIFGPQVPQPSSESEYGGFRIEPFRVYDNEEAEHKQKLPTSYFASSYQPQPPTKKKSHRSDKYRKNSQLLRDLFASSDENDSDLDVTIRPISFEEPFRPPPHQTSNGRRVSKERKSFESNREQSLMSTLKTNEKSQSVAGKKQRPTSRRRSQASTSVDNEQKAPSNIGNQDERSPSVPAEQQRPMSRRPSRAKSQALVSTDDEEQKSLSKKGNQDERSQSDTDQQQRPLSRRPSRAKSQTLVSTDDEEQKSLSKKGNQSRHGYIDEASYEDNYDQRDEDEAYQRQQSPTFRRSRTATRFTNDGSTRIIADYSSTTSDDEDDKRKLQSSQQNQRRKHKLSTLKIPHSSYQDEGKVESTLHKENASRRQSQTERESDQNEGKELPSGKDKNMNATKNLLPQLNKRYEGNDLSTTRTNLDEKHQPERDEPRTQRLHQEDHEAALTSDYYTDDGAEKLKTPLHGQRPFFPMKLVSEDERFVSANEGNPSSKLQHES